MQLIAMLDNLRHKTIGLLRWSERYTKTDMLYLARGGFWLTIGQVFSALSAFILALAFANLLPKEVFGTYRFVLSLVSILAITNLGGINTALVRAVAKGHEGSWKSALLARIRWGLIGGVASLLVATYYWINGNVTLTFSFLIAAPFIPFMDSFLIYGAVLIGKKRFKRSSAYTILSRLLTVGAITAILFLSNNTLLILAIYFASWTSIRAFFLRRTIKQEELNKEIEKTTVSYGKHLTLMGALGTISNQLDRILLFHFLGAAEVAIYAIAIALPEQIKGLIKNINVLALPKFSTKSGPEIARTIYPKMWKFSAVLILIALVYIVFAPPLFSLFFSQYSQSVRLSQIFALSIPTLLLFIPVNILEAQQKTRQLYYFQLTTAIVQIALVIPFIIFYGLMGAILAWVVGRYFNLTYAILLLRKALATR